MITLVQYPPQNASEYSCLETHALGLIPVRIVVSRRVDGWCAYLLLKRMPIEFCFAYGDTPSEPTPWDRVRDNGDKIPAQYALELFPEMGEDYVG